LSATAFHCRRLAVIGVGLIGGSLARALREARAVDHVIGCTASRASVDRALALGVIDDGTTSVEDAVSGADMIVVTTPVGAMAEVFGAIMRSAGPDAVITDGGSVKGEVVEAARARLGDRLSRFVPGHPIAGTERSGVEASFATLYHGRRTVLTPIEETDPDAVARVRAMWACCGSDVSEMSVSDHDRILAATSHLPHVLAFALVDFMAGRPDGSAHFALAAGGFYDFTRIASSDPRMWRDICMANRRELEPVLQAFLTHLQGLADALARGDGEALVDTFARAKGERDRHLPDGWRSPRA
jgi:prephenate dehydrogenase